MKSLSTSLPVQLVTPSAANADQLGERPAVVPATAHAEPGGGWDSYEVWRRFIKDARDRRQSQE